MLKGVIYTYTSNPSVFLRNDSRGYIKHIKTHFLFGSFTNLDLNKFEVNRDKRCRVKAITHIYLNTTAIFINQASILKPFPF